MKNKNLQLFSDEYLAACKNMTAKQILTYLDNFRKLHGSNQSSKSKLISIKIPENLLDMFKARAKLENMPYQTLIKQLMKAYLEK